MAQRLQMNISKDDKTFRYLIDVDDTVSATNGSYGAYGVDILNENGTIQILNQTRRLNNIVRDVNIWKIYNVTHDNYYIPNSVVQKKVRLYIPTYSIERLYDDKFVDGVDLSGLRYIVTAYTYINGYEVIVGSYIFSPGDTIASPKVFNYKGNEYRSMIEFNIIDPATLTYSDDWAQFRQDFCEEPAGTNNTGSVLNFDLHIVSKFEDGWIESVEFKGCSNGLAFNRYTNDIMHSTLTFDNGATMELLFNEEYGNDLWTYMQETYGVDGGCVVIYELLIRDKDNVYLAPPVAAQVITDPWIDLWQINTGGGELIYNRDGSDTREVRSTRIVENNRIHPDIPEPPYHKFTRRDFFQDTTLDWNWYKDGLVLQGCIYLFKPDVDYSDFETLMEEEVPVMEFLTNEIPITREIFKFLLPLENELGLEKINFDYIDMQEYNVHVVNKIHKEVININRPDDYKANILKPVFIRSVDLKNITIHPQVTENISFNLNRYKSVVNLFYIRIEGVDFIESGRTDSTVVFRVDGSRLPNEITEGKFFILNENFEAITSGNYIYE